MAKVVADGGSEASTGPVGFRIQTILVENNYDKVVKKDAPDHLNLLLESIINKDIDNLKAYYIITDTKLNKLESYIKR